MRLAGPILLASMLSISGLSANATDLLASKPSGASKLARAGETRFRALYGELVEINTTLSSGSCAQAAEAMKARLSRAGYANNERIRVQSLLEGREFLHRLTKMYAGGK
jgi:hypothetical protein